MAFGDGADDAALDRAWNEFCERLKAAGKHAFKDFNAISGLQRADAFRFLTQNLGQAFDLALETRDTRYPAMHAFCNSWTASLVIPAGSWKLIVPMRFFLCPLPATVSQSRAEDKSAI